MRKVRNIGRVLALGLIPVTLASWAQSASNVQTITIADDDPVPTANFSTAAQSLAEGNSGTTQVTVGITLSNTNSASITVPYTISGGTATNPADHNAAPGSVVINPGSASGNIVFSVVGDTGGEADETVIFIMGTPTNAAKGTQDVHTVTILNDDVDTIPDPFNFTDLFNVGRNMVLVSNEITITGITPNTPVSVAVSGTAGYGYFKNGVGPSTAATTAIAGDKFKVRHTTASDYESTRSTTLTVGGVSETFSTTTRQDPNDQCNPMCP